MAAARAFAELQSGSGTHFDPECVTAFLKARPKVEALLEKEAAERLSAEGGSNTISRSELERAQQSPLFKTPIAHFLVRAFHAEGVDEFLAHITTIEAALGLHSDYDRKTRPKIARRRNVTYCMAARVAALLDTKTDGAEYRRLFDFRSDFLHGRKMAPIPSEARIAARRLARRVVNGLVKVALANTTPRNRGNFSE